MKKKYLMYAILPVLGLSLLAGGTTYAAMAKTEKNGGPFKAIASAIAQKFNLNTADVQTVIDETLETERIRMEKNRPNPLAKAVTDGKLTQAQADLIKAKHEEERAQMESDRESMENMTQAEREAAIKAHREDLKKWATENNIPEQYVMFFGKPGNRGNGVPGFGRPGFGKGALPATDTEASNN